MCLGEAPSFPVDEAYHDIMEVLGLFYRPQALARYFMALYIPKMAETERTFYAAARLVRYSEEGPPG